ncbi:hypothetical protein, partial [Janthinobacterium sp.]|uniref:hypothetical protein n=1 Tax=Janthinobacterium sp. TaxID=1871054 RepID=UPI00258A1990
PLLAHVLDLAHTLKTTSDPIEAASVAGALANEYWNLPKEPVFRHTELNDHAPERMVKEALAFAFQKKIEDEQLQPAWSALVPAFRAKVAEFLENGRSAGLSAIRVEACYDAAYGLTRFDVVAVESDSRKPYAFCDTGQRRITIVLRLPAAGESEAQRGKFADSLAELFSEEFQRAQLWSYKYTL